jgi:hypothetical protein
MKIISDIYAVEHFILIIIVSSDPSALINIKIVKTTFFTSFRILFIHQH